MPLLEQILQRAPVGMAVVDHNGVFRSVNPSYCQLYGYRREELLGQCFTIVSPPPERERILALHRGFVERGGELGGELEVRGRDGRLLHAITRSVVVPGDDGRPWRLVYVVDITGRRQMEAALEASQRLARSVLDGLTAHVCVIDGDGTVVSVNRAWVEFAAANGGAPNVLHEGANYLGVCEAAVRTGIEGVAEARQFLTLFRELQAGQRRDFQLEYACHSLQEKRWFLVRVSRMEGSDPPAYIVAHDNVTALKLAQEALRQRADTDELTGVASRRSVLDALRLEFERLKRHPALRCSVLAVDLDQFKQINDQWGHAAGDAVLRHFAQVVSGQTRAGDVVGRTGGEEFMILLPDTSPDEAQALGERLRLQVSLEPTRFDEHRIGVTVSIGIAVLTASDAEASAVLRRADRALYEAKHAGRNAVRRWHVGEQEAPERSAGAPPHAIDRD